MTKRWFIFIGVTILVVVGGVLMQSGSRHSGYAPRRMTNDVAIAVTRFAFTEGTNHTFSTASPLMTRINSLWVALGRKLGRKPVARVLQPRAITTTRETSVVWISLTHTNRRPPIVQVLLTGPDGLTELIGAKSGLSAGSNLMMGFALPSHATNYPGWWFHVVKAPAGTRLVSFEL